MQGLGKQTVGRMLLLKQFPLFHFLQELKLRYEYHNTTGKSVIQLICPEMSVATIHSNYTDKVFQHHILGIISLINTIVWDNVALLQTGQKGQE